MNPVKKTFLRCAIHSLMSFHAFVYDASLHHFYLNRDYGKIDTTALLRLSYQTEAIKGVNERLQRPERRPSEALLVSFLILAITWPE